MCVCEFVFVCMCMGVCYMCKCVNEREREREREREGSSYKGNREIRHTVLSLYVPKLGLELKWVKGNVLVYQPT